MGVAKQIRLPSCDIGIPWETLHAFRITPHIRARGGGAAGKNHKRPAKLELGLQAWVAYSVRFVMAGDLASDWETFGGISTERAQLGTALNPAVSENAKISTTYDQKVRTYAYELPTFQTREKGFINLRTVEGRRIKRECVRECGSTTTLAPRNAGLGRKKGQAQRPAGSLRPKGEGNTNSDENDWGAKSEWR